MKIDMLCTDPSHPVVPWLKSWIVENGDEDTITLLHDARDLQGGGILFLVSCSQLIAENTRASYEEVLVLHASDLPEGRGWSPHIWAVLDGAEQITLSLISAEDPVDTGPIWAKIRFDVPRAALYDELNARLFEAELELLSKGIKLIKAGAQPQPQSTGPSSYWPRRTPADSELDPSRSLVELFDKIRVADPERYPAFFSLHGRTFTLRIERSEKDD